MLRAAPPIPNRNTRAGSRRNIGAHYDLGNGFYALWLDPSWNYSGAWWGDTPALGFERAQNARWIARWPKSACAGMRLLEIGCGWGALAERGAAQRTLTGVTLSTEQLAFARRRLGEAGLAQHGPAPAGLPRPARRSGARAATDGIVSIEMVEAVGEAWWPTWFERCARACGRAGAACVQSIVIADALFDDYRRGAASSSATSSPAACCPRARPSSNRRAAPAWRW